MNRALVGIVSLLLVSGTVWPIDASAQPARRRVQAYARVDIDRIIRRLEDRSDRFRETVDRSLDRSRLNGSRAEDRINEQIKQLENALDDLRSEFDRRDRFDETRRRVERAMRQSDEVNALVRSRRLGPQVDSEWGVIRADLNTLAVAYNLRPLR